MEKIVVLGFKFREVSARLEVLCVVARCLGSGRTWRHWLADGGSLAPDFPLGITTVLIGHEIAAAEARCIHALGWNAPCEWIDTYVEERILASGTKQPEGFGLLACCRRRGIRAMAVFEELDMAALCLKQGLHDGSDRKRILDFCEADVEANADLFGRIRDQINLPQALLRGRYVVECSRIQARGIPVDKARLDRLTRLGNVGLRRLFAEHFDDHGVLHGGSLNRDRFEELVDHHDIPWPRTSSGVRVTDKQTLKEMARIHGEPWCGIRQLLEVTRCLKVDALKDRGDGRLVADLRPFGTITGRCAPSSSGFLLNGPRWLRFLLQPPPGRSLISVDWSNQEFAIAAALSSDQAMINSYATGDPYLALARMAGRVPPSATGSSHPAERETFKVISLAVLMGMTEQGLAIRLGKDTYVAKELLELHRKCYPAFWSWSDAVANTAGAHRPLETAFGLFYRPGLEIKTRTARNFLLQATASDMLRVAVLLIAERGLEIIATVHDSILIECDTSEAEEVERVASACMGEASLITLWDRLEVRRDITRVDFPHHYTDKKSRPVWDRLAALLNFDEGK